MLHDCNLTIFEPDKEPRIVNLQIHDSQIFPGVEPVFDEHGTLLTNYKVEYQTESPPDINEKIKDYIQKVEFKESISESKRKKLLRLRKAREANRLRKEAAKLKKLRKKVRVANKRAKALGAACASDASTSGITNQQKLEEERRTLKKNAMKDLLNVTKLSPMTIDTNFKLSPECVVIEDSDDECCITDTYSKNCEIDLESDDECVDSSDKVVTAEAPDEEEMPYVMQKEVPQETSPEEQGDVVIIDDSDDNESVDSVDPEDFLMTNVACKKKKVTFSEEEPVSESYFQGLDYIPVHEPIDEEASREEEDESLKRRRKQLRGELIYLGKKDDSKSSTTKNETNFNTLADSETIVQVDTTRPKTESNFQDIADQDDYYKDEDDENLTAEEAEELYEKKVRECLREVFSMHRDILKKKKKRPNCESGSKNAKKPKFENALLPKSVMLEVKNKIRFQVRSKPPSPIAELKILENPLKKLAPKKSAPPESALADQCDEELRDDIACLTSSPKRAQSPKPKLSAMSPQQKEKQISPPASSSSTTKTRWKHKEFLGTASAKPQVQGVNSRPRNNRDHQLQPEESIPYHEWSKRVDSLLWKIRSDKEKVQRTKQDSDIEQWRRNVDDLLNKIRSASNTIVKPRKNKLDECDKLLNTSRKFRTESSREMDNPAASGSNELNTNTHNWNSERDTRFRHNSTKPFYQVDTHEPHFSSHTEAPRTNVYGTATIFPRYGDRFQQSSENRSSSESYQNPSEDCDESDNAYTESYEGDGCADFDEVYDQGTPDNDQPQASYHHDSYADRVQPQSPYHYGPQPRPFFKAPPFFRNRPPRPWNNFRRKMQVPCVTRMPFRRPYFRGHCDMGPPPPRPQFANRRLIQNEHQSHDFLEMPESEEPLVASSSKKQKTKQKELNNLLTPEGKSFTWASKKSANYIPIEPSEEPEIRGILKSSKRPKKFNFNYSNEVPEITKEKGISSWKYHNPINEGTSKVPCQSSSINQRPQNFNFNRIK